MIIYRIQSDEHPPQIIKDAVNNVGVYYIDSKDLSGFLDYCIDMGIKIVSISIISNWGEIQDEKKK